MILVEWDTTLDTLNSHKITTLWCCERTVNNSAQSGDGRRDSASACLYSMEPGDAYVYSAETCRWRYVCESVTCVACIWCYMVHIGEHIIEDNIVTCSAHGCLQKHTCVYAHSKRCGWWWQLQHSSKWACRAMRCTEIVYTWAKRNWRHPMTEAITACNRRLSPSLTLLESV